MKLFLRPGACSQAVHIVLHEVGAEFETAEVDLTTKQLADGSDYLAINPRGQVPALLLDDGSLLMEGPAINQYLADLHGAAGLLPPVGDRARYDVLGWLNFVATEVHKSISPLMRPTTPADYRQAASAYVESKFAFIDEHLTDRDYLDDDAGYTIADIYLFVVSGWMPRIGIDARRFPAIMAFRERIATRPGVRAALAAEGFS